MQETRWKTWYTVVVMALLAEVLLFYIFTHYFS